MPSPRRASRRPGPLGRRAGPVLCAARAGWLLVPWGLGLSVSLRGEVLWGEVSGPPASPFSVGERQRNVRLLFHLPADSCAALTGDRTLDLGVSGRCSSQLSTWPGREASLTDFLGTPCSEAPLAASRSTCPASEPAGVTLGAGARVRVAARSHPELCRTRPAQAEPRVPALSAEWPGFSEEPGLPWSRRSRWTSQR